MLKFLLTLLVIAPTTLAAIMYLAFDTEPSIDRAADISPASIERAKRLLEQNDPRALRPGVHRTLSIGEDDLDHAANYLARQYADGGARVQLNRGGAHLEASLRVPKSPIKLYVNFDTTLAESGSLARIDSLRIGKVALPGWLAQWMAPRLIAIVIAQDDLRAFRRAIKKISIQPNRIALTYEWQADLPAKLRTVLLPPDDRERLRVYHERLVVITKSLTESNISLTALLVPLFSLAGDRSNRANAVAENRAVILVLALYVNGQDLRGIVPEAKTWPAPRRHEVLLNGRDDFPKHFIISAALAAKAGGPLSDAVGLYKELADSREGSGFSFNDMAADRAGTRFGEYAADSGSARRLQERLRGGAAERDLMPGTEDLPEFMPEKEFIRRYGGVDAPPYNKMMAEIDRRVSTLPLYR